MSEQRWNEMLMPLPRTHKRAGMDLLAFPKNHSVLPNVKHPVRSVIIIYQHRNM